MSAVLTFTPAPKAFPPNVISVECARRERQIRHLGVLLQSAMDRYERSNELGDLGEAHRYRMEMEQLISERPPEYVAWLEEKRGLS